MNIRKNNILLPLVILTAMVVRIFFIWIGRPEFVGWFNHTYYYFVQVEGLLINSSLPFPDMPLLFYIYAITSKLLITFGAETHTAIIISTRFWMSIIPSLIPIPVFFTLKNINPRKELDNYLWILISISAFMPLSMVHIPELLQKKMHSACCF